MLDKNSSTNSEQVTPAPYGITDAVFHDGPGLLLGSLHVYILLMCFTALWMLDTLNKEFAKKKKNLGRGTVV